MSERAGEILGRIQQYLVMGGLFNPELANHDAVSRLAIDARDEIHALAAENEKLRFALAIRCRHGYKLTQTCAACAESTEDGCERVIYLDPDGVHLKSKELLCATSSEGEKP